MTQPYDERPDEHVPAAPATPAEPAPAEPAEAEPAPSAVEKGLGDARVEAAVARLDDLAERPVGEHAEVFDDIHQRLRDALEEAAVEPADGLRG
jgi:hypothetical protein